MRFGLACAAAASAALIMEGVEARYSHPGLDKHMHEKRQMLEVKYGKGMMGMFNSDGTYNQNSLRRYGDEDSGETVTNIGNLEIDTTSLKAYFNGFALGMQYSGLARDDVVQALELSNCFAAMVSFGDVLEKWLYDMRTMFADMGNIKLVKVFAHDFPEFMGEATVTYQYCEFARILQQFKGMAGLDYAALAESSTRILGKMIFENPEYRREIKNMRAAAKCLKEVGEDFAEEFGDDDFESTDRGDNWNDLQTMDDVGELAEAAAACTATLDRFVVGEISGKLFAGTFNNYVETEQ